MRALSWLVLVAVTVGCSGADLQSGLDERQANEAVVVLDQAGIAADKVREETGRTPTYRLRVARGEVARALTVLRAHELPRERPRGVLDVFGQPSLIPSATQERALHVAAVSGELARTLETVDGVLAARVHLSLPEEGPLGEGERRSQPTAAVLLKARPGTNLAADDVRRLVAGSVDGLTPARVSVVTTPAPAAPPAPAGGLRSVGPFRVAAASRAPLLVTLGGALVLVIFLCAALVVVTLRGSRAARRAAAPGDVVEPPRTSGAVIAMTTRGGPPR
jgi:type III secretion protein J